MATINTQQQAASLPAAAANAGLVAAKTETGPQSFQNLLSASRVEGFEQAAQAADLGTDNDQTEDRFLALLVAQMQNQDPLNPLENAEVTTQLAQINTVRGIEDLGTSMKALLAKFEQTGPTASADMIGRQVLVPTSYMDVTDIDTGPVTAAAELAQPASDVRLQVFGADGSVLRDVSMGSHDAGLMSFEWDGKDQEGEWAPEGRYFFRVLASGADGDAMPITSVAATVNAVQGSGNSVNLRLEGGQLVPVDSVKAVF